VADPGRAGPAQRRGHPGAAAGRDDRADLGVAGAAGQGHRLPRGRRAQGCVGREDPRPRRYRGPQARHRRRDERPESTDRRHRRPGMTPEPYVLLSAILFSIGALGVLVRRNAIVVFMCVELMLNATNLAFVSFARQHGSLDGQSPPFFVVVVAAAEVVVGLAIIMAIFRTRRSASVDDANLLKYSGAP